jgi:predicted ribosome-associated RNA-binding protein Tma20
LFLQFDFNDCQIAYLAPDGDPLWFTVGKGSDDLVPTIYTLWKHRELLPFLSTPAPVIPVLVGGADLMIPGGQCLSAIFLFWSSVRLDTLCGVI